jgi:hypothetical protein
VGELPPLSAVAQHKWIRGAADAADVPPDAADVPPDAADVPPDAVGAIATRCWLSHSLSADLHNVDLAAFTSRDPPRMHGLEGIARARSSTWGRAH